MNLTEELDRFVAGKVASGRYESASEVVRVGLRALEEQERVFEAKLARLGEALVEGKRSSIAEGDVFARARRALARR